MKDVIKKLYYGKMNEMDNMFNREQWLYDERKKETQKLYDSLLDSLADEQRKLFENWREEDIAERCDYESEVYERGFKVGALFIIDVYDVRFND